MKKQHILILFIAILGAVAGALVNHYRTEPKTPEDHAISSLINMSLPDPQGQMQPLSQWHGKPVIVNFWATWCKPCIAEMPGLVALQKDLPSTQIIGIGIDSDAKIREFAEKLNIDYPLYVAGATIVNLLRQLGNPTGGLPFTLVLDEDGKLLKAYIGELDFDVLRQDLKSFQLL